MAAWNLTGDDPNRTLRFDSPLKDLLLRGKKVRDDVAARMTIGQAYAPASEFPDYELVGFDPTEEGFQYPIYAKVRSDQEDYNFEFSKVLSDQYGPQIRQTFIVKRSGWVPSETTPSETPPTFSSAYEWTFIEQRQDRLPQPLDGLYIVITRIWRDIREGVVSESLDSESGEIRTVTRTLVPAGTHGSAPDDSGSMAEVDGINPDWLVRTVRKAPGIAGQAVNGKASRIIPRPMRHYWPPVLSGYFVLPIYEDAGNIYSAIRGYITYPIWKTDSYNGPCKGRMTEMWTRVMPDYDGNPSWPTSGSKPYIPEPTRMLPRSIYFQGPEGFQVSTQACLHPQLVFTDGGFTFTEPATDPEVWPGTIILDVDVRPYMGGWMTTIIELDAPSSAGASTGLNLSYTPVSSTSVDLAWDVAGSGTTLDVATSPDFTRGLLLKDQAVNSTAPLEYTVTGLTRGQIYWARVKRSGLTSNTLQFMATPQSELVLKNGSSVISSALSFASTAVEASTTLTLTILNNGVLSLNNLAATLSGTHNTDFIVGTLPTTVAANGGTATFDLTFNPQGSGSRTASLSLASDDPASPLVISLTGTATDPEINVKYSGTSYATGSTIAFGSVDTGSSQAYTITIENTGTGNLTVAAAVGAGDWQLTTAPDGTVAAGGSTTLQVTFIPTAGGTLTSTLTIINTDLDEDPYTITLSGTGVAVGEIEVQDPLGLVVETSHSYDFGTVDAAGSNTRIKTFTIYNRGAGTLSSLAAAVSGGNAGDFTVSALGSTSLAAAASTTFTVTFDPSATGARTTTLAITSSDSDESPTNITLNGIGGTGPDIQVEYPATTVIADGGSLDFGNALLSGGTIERTFTIRNLGTSSLSVTGCTTTGGNSADFTVSGISLPASIAADGTTTFKVTFNPSGYGVRTCTLRLTNNASTVSKQTYDITISGTGTPADALTTYQSANVVLGQADFDDQVASNTSSLMSNVVWGAAISPAGKLAIVNVSDGSVYVWNSVPTANGAAADFLLLDITGGVSNGWSTVAWSGEDLLVGGVNTHRILRYAAPVSASSTPANVIGQPNLTTYSSGLTAAKLNTPYGIRVTSSGKLIVADSGNNRVLVWNSVPTTNGVAANVVIGQTGFTVATTGSAANKFNKPYDVAEMPDGKLLVADSSNNRVCVFASIPTVNNASATHVLLQSGFGVTGSGSTATTCSTPRSVACNDLGQVAVGDYQNSRVALFYELPTASGASMDAVLGQASISSSAGEWAGGSPNSQNMRYPLGVCWDGNDLIVTGWMKRAMIFKPA